jgi:hypothetical protein
MTTYPHDGTVFDLDKDFADVTGVIWSWTGEWSPEGEPLLESDVRGLPLVPLPTVYHDHGPLLPIARKAPLVNAFAKSLAAGLTESYDAFDARIGGPR